MAEMAEVSGGLGRSLGWSQTQEANPRDWREGDGFNEEIREIPSLLPAPPQPLK